MRRSFHYTTLLATLALPAQSNAQADPNQFNPLAPFEQFRVREFTPYTPPQQRPPPPVPQPRPPSPSASPVPSPKTLEYVIDEAFHATITRKNGTAGLHAPYDAVWYQFEVTSQNVSKKRLSQPPPLREASVIFKIPEIFNDETLEGLTIHYRTNMRREWQPIPEEPQTFPGIFYLYQGMKHKIPTIETAEKIIRSAELFFAWLESGKPELQPTRYPEGQSFALYIPVADIMTWINATAFSGEYVTGVRIKMPFLPTQSQEEPYYFIKFSTGNPNYPTITGSTEYALEISDSCTYSAWLQDKGRIVGGRDKEQLGSDAIQQVAGCGRRRDLSPSTRGGVEVGRDCDGVIHNDHCYRYFTRPITTFSEGKEACSTWGGYLTTISDAVENNFILSLTQTNLPSGLGGGVLLGLSYTQTSPFAGRWVWANGEPVTYTNFGHGEPNNLPGENWTVLMPFAQGNYLPGQWNNVREPFSTPDFSTHVVCEK